jgi:hypothetical protein
VAGRRAGAGLALAAIALSAAGCGIGGSTKTVTVVRVHTHTITVTTTVTQSSSTTTSQAAPATCTGSQLSGNFQAVGGSGAAGQISYELKLTNTSQTRCSVTGVPQVQLLDAKKAALPTHVVGPHSDMLVTPVLMAPGVSATAQARFSSSVPGKGDAKSGPCQPEAWYLRVSPGGGGTVDTDIAPPTSVCERGTLNFSVYAG